MAVPDSSPRRLPHRGPGRAIFIGRFHRAVAAPVTWLICGWLLAAAVADEPAGKRVPGTAGQSKQAPKPAGSIYSDPEGKAQVSLFGATGEGYKFVYVFDRSASMGGEGKQALKVLKAELLESLKPLDSVHQFQIIFYNERPVIFNPSGMRGQLAFATEQNKDRAARFIQSIAADGNTRHDDALKLAVRMRPDVIFFLTDGDDPKLSRRELDQVNRLAAGIRINAIEFGSGPRPAGKSFLAVLAQENGGQYVYVDILDYPPGSAQDARDKPAR